MSYIEVTVILRATHTLRAFHRCIIAAFAVILERKGWRGSLRQSSNVISLLDEAAWEGNSQFSVSTQNITVSPTRVGETEMKPCQGTSCFRAGTPNIANCSDSKKDSWTSSHHEYVPFYYSTGFACNQRRRSRTENIIINWWLNKKDFSGQFSGLFRTLSREDENSVFLSTFFW